MATFFKKPVIEIDTGRVIQTIAFIPDIKDEDFLKIFPLFGKKILQDLGLLHGEIRFLVWLIAKTIELPYQSDLWIPISYEDVAKDLGITVRSVKTYTKKLLELGYIEQFKRRHSTFRLKPDFFYKGNLKKYKIACYEEDIKRQKGT